MKAVVFEAFGEAPTIRNVPDPDAVAGRRRRQGRGDRALPQRLARLDGTRSRHPPAACARPRTRRYGRRRRQPRHALEGRRPRDRAFRRRLRPLLRMRVGQPPGLREPVPAGLLGLGLLRRICRARLCRHQSRGAAGRDGVRHGRQPRLPLRHLLPRRRRPGPRHAGRMGRGAWLRRRRPVGDHDRQRHGRQCRRHRPDRRKA